MSSKADCIQAFSVEKHEKKLNHFIWSCTRVYFVKHAYSLSEGNPLPNELTTVEARVRLEKAANCSERRFGRGLKA
jgi:hypothetical protein